MAEQEDEKQKIHGDQKKTGNNNSADLSNADAGTSAVKSSDTSSAMSPDTSSAMSSVMSSDTSSAMSSVMSPDTSSGNDPDGASVQKPASSDVMNVYFDNLRAGLQRELDLAGEARKRGEDPHPYVEIPLANDLADRVENLIGIKGVAARVRELSQTIGNREEVALRIGKEIAEGKVGGITSREEAVEAAIRVSMAVITEGVVAAPLEGVVGIKIDKNPDGTEYLRIYYSGPIRSAGGTAQALSVLAGDYVRRVVGLDRFKPRDEVVERYAEEIRIYKTTASLQYSPSDDEIRTIIRNCPVCVDGDGTENAEVQGFRNLPEIPTNRIRGGMALVVAEGMILKAPKVQKHVKKLKIDGWDFLEQIIAGSKASKGGDEPSGGPKVKPKDKYMHDLIAGRPLFSEPSRPGGFRLRYGRSRNTSFASAGINPSTMYLLSEFITNGTQIKVERPGKAAGMSSVDSIQGPSVRLRSGDFLRIEGKEPALALRNMTEYIVDIGEILFNYGDFLENNHLLMPSPYCFEWWLYDYENVMDPESPSAPDPPADVRKWMPGAEERGLWYAPEITSDERKLEHISAEEALRLASLGIPLHPDFTYLWHDVTVDELEKLYDLVRSRGSLIYYETEGEVPGTEKSVPEGPVYARSKSRGDRSSSGEDISELIDFIDEDDGDEFNYLTDYSYDGDGETEMFADDSAAGHASRKVIQADLSGNPSDEYGRMMMFAGTDNGNENSCGSENAGGNENTDGTDPENDSGSVSGSAAGQGPAPGSANRYASLRKPAEEPFDTAAYLESGFTGHVCLALPYEECLASDVKIILENLLVFHRVRNGRLLIADPAPLLRSLGLLGKDRFTVDAGEDISSDLPLRYRFSDSRYPVTTALEAVNILSGICIKARAPSRIGARMGRPEKSDKRKMSPAAHSLFPLGEFGGKARIFAKAAEYRAPDAENAGSDPGRPAKPASGQTTLFGKDERQCGRFSVRAGLRKCPECGEDTYRWRCSCGAYTVAKIQCPRCQIETSDEICPACGRPTTNIVPVEMDFSRIFKKALNRLGFTENSAQTREIRKLEIKGVKKLTSKAQSPEPIEKGILRARHGLTMFKDGTIRYDMSDIPLTHIRADELGITTADLLRLGYTHDIYGKPLVSDDQVVCLFIQDIIVSYDCAGYILRTTQYIDDLLVRYYGMAPYYNARSIHDLVGTMMMGLAPHTSAGVLCRLIGFTTASVGFAHPYFHASKRRNCDGDEDCVMLLLDGLLNFSREYLPDKRGGRMDAPLVLTTILDPKEVDKEAQNIDMGARYPLGFYLATEKFTSPGELEKKIDLVSGRLGRPDQYEKFRFTHDTTNIAVGPRYSSYKVLGSMSEKMEAQMNLGMIIRAVDVIDVAEKVLTSHLLPDIIGNLRAFSRQSTRCLGCEAKFRRPPLSGTCPFCGGKVILTVHEGAVRKYVDIARNVAEKYGVSDYTVERINIVAEDIRSTFENKDECQTKLDRFSPDRSSDPDVTLL